MVSALAPRRTLIDTVVPRESVGYQVALILGGSIFLALLSQVSIRLPFTPVPITGQTFGVLLVGAVLGSRRSALSMLCYLAEGGLGLPVFAGGTSGLPVGPTGGYLIGFVLMAWLVGTLTDRGWDQRFGSALIAMVAGEVLLYLVALPWLALYVGWARAIPLGFLPFVPGDAFKLVLAGVALPGAWRLVGRRRLG